MENVKTNNAYECMFVSDLTGARDAAETVAKFVGLVEKNGEIIDVTEWGKRRFEYPINDKNEGYYTIVTFRAESSFPAEFERLLNIDENIMRSFIIKLDEEEVAKVIRRAADKAAAASAPVEEAPVEEAPVEAAPVEEAVAEEAAAEEAPAADAE